MICHRSQSKSHSKASDAVECSVLKIRVCSMLHKIASSPLHLMEDKSTLSMSTCLNDVVAQLENACGPRLLSSREKSCDEKVFSCGITMAIWLLQQVDLLSIELLHSFDTTTISQHVDYEEELNAEEIVAGVLYCRHRAEKAISDWILNTYGRKQVSMNSRKNKNNPKPRAKGTKLIFDELILYCSSLMV